MEEQEGSFILGEYTVVKSEYSNMAKSDIGHVHTYTLLFENAYFSLCFGFPSTLRWRFVKEDWGFLKHSPKWINLKMQFPRCSVDCHTIAKDIYFIHNSLYYSPKEMTETLLTAAF